jgi:hypothetical protein
MDPKLSVLFCLIDTVIGLSHFSGEEPSKLKRQADGTSEYRAAAEEPQVAPQPIESSIKADRSQTNRG